MIIFVLFFTFFCLQDAIYVATFTDHNEIDSGFQTTYTTGNLRTPVVKIVDLCKFCLIP